MHACLIVGHGNVSMSDHGMHSIHFFVLFLQSFQGGVDVPNRDECDGDCDGDVQVELPIVQY